MPVFCSWRFSSWSPTESLTRWRELRIIIFLGYETNWILKTLSRFGVPVGWKWLKDFWVNRSCHQGRDDLHWCFPSCLHLRDWCWMWGKGDGIAWTLPSKVRNWRSHQQKDFPCQLNEFRMVSTWSKSRSLITHCYQFTSSCGIKFANRVGTADFPHVSVRLTLHHVTSRIVDYFIRRGHQIFWSFWSQPCCLVLKSTLICFWLVCSSALHRECVHGSLLCQMVYAAGMNTVFLRKNRHLNFQCPIVNGEPSKSLPCEADRWVLR